MTTGTACAGLATRRRCIAHGFALVLAAAFLQGCLIVRTTEQRVWFKKDGTGEGIIRLIDIRSDEPTPDGAKADFESMMRLYLETGLTHFENAGRTVTGKHFSVSGDTLIAEIRYRFSSVAALDEMRFTNDEIFVVVPAGKTIGKNNGSVESFVGGSRRIVWDRNTARISYEISERTLPKSTSMGSMYSSSQGK